jgi:hypothetical protein
MKVFQVVIHYSRQGSNHYVVQAETPGQAIDNVVRDRSLGNDPDSVEFSVYEIDLSKVYFVAST